MSKDNKLKIEYKTPQQLIAEIELEKILEIVNVRPLTLEEVKIYDLLCKNLNVSKESATKALDAQYRKIDDDRKSIPDQKLIDTALEKKEPNE